MFFLEIGSCSTMFRNYSRYIGKYLSNFYWSSIEIYYYGIRPFHFVIRKVTTLIKGG